MPDSVDMGPLHAWMKTRNEMQARLKLQVGVNYFEAGSEELPRLLNVFLQNMSVFLQASYQSGTFLSLLQRYNDDTQHISLSSYLLFAWQAQVGLWVRRAEGGDEEQPADDEIPEVFVDLLAVLGYFFSPQSLSVRTLFLDGGEVYVLAEEIKVRGVENSAVAMQLPVFRERINAFLRQSGLCSLPDRRGRRRRPAPIPFRASRVLVMPHRLHQPHDDAIDITRISVYQHANEEPSGTARRYRRYTFAIFLVHLVLGATFDTFNKQAVFFWSSDFWGAGALTIEVGALAFINTLCVSRLARTWALVASLSAATAYWWLQGFYNDGVLNTENSYLRKGLGIYFAMMSLSTYLRLEFITVDPKCSVFRLPGNWPVIIGLYALYISYYFFQYYSTDAQYNHLVEGAGYYGFLVFSLELARTEIWRRFYGQDAAMALHTSASLVVGESGVSGPPAYIRGRGAVMQLHGIDDAWFSAGILLAAMSAWVLAKTQTDMPQFASEFLQGVNLVALLVLSCIEGWRLSLRYFGMSLTGAYYGNAAYHVENKKVKKGIQFAGALLIFSAYLWAPKIQDPAWAKTFLMSAWLTNVFVGDLAACKVADYCQERELCCFSP